MPELPEVETVARDLRPLITGATIVDATTLWARTLRGITPEAFATGVAGRRIEGVSRRGKQVVVSLDGDAFLTIHLKMTGQLFVVRQGAPDDPYVRLVLELEDGREIRFRDIRKFGRVGLYVAADDDPFAQTGPEPLADAFTVAAFRRRIRGRKGRLKPLLLDQSFIAGVGNIYADEALWAARLHPAPDREDAAARRRAAPLAGAPPDPRRGRDPARLVDRRLHGARRRRRDAGPPARLPAGRRAVLPLRTADSTDRRRWPGDPLLLVVPATLGRRPGGRPGDSPLDGHARPTRPALVRAAGRGGERRAQPGGADPQGRRDAPRRRARLGRGLAVSILRLTDVHREVGTFVILDSISASIAVGDRIGLVGPNGAGKTTLMRLAAGRDEPDAGEVHRKRGLTLGLLAQESHFDDEFMAAPDLRAAVRQGASHLDRMAESARRVRAGPPRRGARLRPPPARVRDPRRLHARSARRRGVVGSRVQPG